MVRNPYKRALLLAALREIETEGNVIREAIVEILPEIMTDLVDAHGSAIVNIFSKKRVKSLFKKRQRRKTKQTGQSQQTKTYTVPDGKGGWKTIDTY